MDILAVTAIATCVGSAAGSLVGFLLVTKSNPERVIHPVVTDTLRDAADKVRKVTPQAGPSWRKTQAILEARRTPEQLREARVTEFTGESHAS